MYIDNYLALFSCIVTPRRVDVDSIIRIITGQDVTPSRGKKIKGTKIKLIDTVTNDIKIFNNHNEALQYFNVPPGSLSRALNNGTLYRKRYLLQKI